MYNMEKGLKREDIDRAIAGSFIEEGCADIHPSFMGNLKFINETLEDNGTKNSSLTAIFLSCIMTAQENAINTMRGVLYKLYGAEETDTTQGSNDNTGGNEDVLHG